MSDNENEKVNFEEQPTVALLETPFHDLSVEEQTALVAAMRERRKNAAGTRARAKRTSNKIQGKPATKKQISFTMDDLLGEL